MDLLVFYMYMHLLTLLDSVVRSACLDLLPLFSPNILYLTKALSESYAMFCINMLENICMALVTRIIYHIRRFAFIHIDSRRGAFSVI